VDIDKHTASFFRQRCAHNEGSHKVSAVSHIMKKLASLFLVMLALGYLVVPSRAGDEVDKNLTKQISDILTECKKIAPGTTRTELLKVFTTEGGLSTAKHRTFVHRRCPYIKVDVDFTASDPKQKDERPTDTVSKISKPYLEWSIID
jgi:hypothetical protein